MYGVYTVFLAGKSPNIRSYMVYTYGSGQPYSYTRAGGVRSIFGREITEHTVVYGVYIRFWPTLLIYTCRWCGRSCALLMATPKCAALTSSLTGLHTQSTLHVWTWAF
jgi:hypothetical protein